MTFALVAVAAASFAQCATKAGCGDKKASCSAQVSAEDRFLAEAREMEMKAEGKKACCKSTAAKPIAKGDKGCCNEKGAQAKFKVFVAGHGYKFFGCEGSAKKGRQELVARHTRVGRVQPVVGNAAI